MAIDLDTILERQLSSGYIDVSELQDEAYTLVFDQLGIPFRIYINNGSWLYGGAGGGVTGYSFSGNIAGESKVLGVAAPAPITIVFSEIQNSDRYALRMSVTLPASWRFGQSFPLLNDGLFNDIKILNPEAFSSQLIVQASGAVVLDPDAYPPLTFNGYIDQNSSVFTVLSWFISGGIQNPVTGAIGYVAASNAVDMDLSFATGTASNLFGSSGPSFSIALSLYSGIDPLINQYDPGIKLLTSIQFGDGGMTFPMSAVYSVASTSSIQFNVGPISISFESALTSIQTFFGNSTVIVAAIPSAIQQSSLVIESLSFLVGTQSWSLISSWMAVSALENSPWEIWPGVLTLSNIYLSLQVNSPFSGNSSYNFRFSSETVLGGTDGLPMIIQGELPGLVVQGHLNTPSYSLAPVIEKLFGSDKGLTNELDIVALDFYAGIESQTYSCRLEVSGYWDIEFGDNNTLTFSDVAVSLGYNPVQGLQGILNCSFFVNLQRFYTELDLSASNIRLYGTWHSAGDPIDYEDIAILLGMYGLPNLPDGIDLNLTAGSFELETAGPSISFTLTSASYGSAALIAGKDAQGNWGFVFGMVAGLDLSIDLTDIDVVGNFVPEGMDVIAVNNLRFVGATSTIPLYTVTGDLQMILGSQVNSGLVLSIDLNIGTLFSQTFSVRFGGLNDGTATDVPPPPETTEENEATTLAVSNNQPQDAGSVVPAAQPGPTSAWISVQRSFGPVHIARIGFRITEDNSLGILIDGGVTLAGLTMNLSAFEADIPISAPFWPSFSLGGIEVGYVTPGLTLAGALVKTYGVTPSQYTGELILQAGSFGASAFGSYTTVNNSPSLFAFLAINAPIGGPPFCIVTGISFGFGYNRRLILPTIENVQTYPLVQAAMGITDPEQTINDLNRYIVAAENQYWLAAGIRFTSFEMLNAYAMITASFGTQIELALMGEAIFTLPLAVPGEENLVLAQADMVLLASINPSLGQIAINAQLTSRSFVLDRNAQITGGFAVWFWFGSNTHAGDFSITLGGYNPYFTIPSHYPRVPLLGLNWRISDIISIKGGLYCALTPSVVMAGGNLSATYSCGGVKAWFNVSADFLMRYKPFSFEATLAVSVGASYTIDLWLTTKTVSVTVGASLKLWGPPFAGKATVDLHVMSFTISFGAAKKSVPANIDWSEFRNSFLPPEPSTLTTHQVAQGDTQSLLRFNADSGLASTLSKEEMAQEGVTLDEGETAWVLDAHSPKFSVSSPVPLNSYTPASSNIVLNGSLSSLNGSLGIGPMGRQAGTMTHKLEVVIRYKTGNSYSNDVQNWRVNLLTDNFPAGLWQNTSNSMNVQSLVKNVLSGLQFVPVPAQADVVAPVSITYLLRAQNDTRSANWSRTVQPSADNLAQGMAAFSASLNNPSTIEARNGILNVLNAQGMDVYQPAEIEMSDFSSNADHLLFDVPRMCYLGETSTMSNQNTSV